MLDAALVALEGEPSLDQDAWTEAAARRLLLASLVEDWPVVSELAERLSWHRRRAGLSSIGLRGTLGNRDATRGIDPRARIEALRIEAQTHLDRE
jgi:hypothetical protein